MRRWLQFPAAFGSITDVDPLTKVRVPLPAGSGACNGATQAAHSDPYSTTTAASYAGAAANRAATDGAATNAATDGAAPDTSVSASATHGAATAMTASPAAAAMTASAAARCNFYTSAKRRVFFIEDMKGRQTDVGDFLLAQNKAPCVVLRRISRGCDCGCGC
jgi:hypothetical protein